MITIDKRLELVVLGGVWKERDSCDEGWFGQRSMKGNSLTH